MAPVCPATLMLIIGDSLLRSGARRKAVLAGLVVGFGNDLAHLAPLPLPSY